MREKFKENSEKIKELWLESKTQAVISVACAVALVATSVIAVITLGYGALQILKAIIVPLMVIVVFASDTFKTIFHRIRRQAQSAIQYPVYFGYDGTRIVPNLVDQLFKDLYTRFSVCYFARFNETQNRVFYAFMCNPKPDVIMDYDFIMLLQKIAEHILSRQLSDYGVSNVNCRDLVALDIINDSLIVSFAKNTSGIPEILQEQEHIRNKYLTENSLSGTNKKFTDKW